MEHLSMVAQGILMTLIVTVCAFAIGAVAAVPLALARNSRFTLLRGAARVGIEVVRGVPPLVWLFILYFGIGSGAIRLSSLAAAIIGFGVVTAAYMAEIYRGGLAAISRGQWEAGDALGLSRLAILRDVIGPQVLRVSIPAAAAYAIGLLKDSSIASVIGVQDIVFFANQEASKTADGITPFLFAAGLYIAMTIPCAWLTRRLDARLRKRVAR